MVTRAAEPLVATDSFRLSPQQIAYFHTFGFLHLPGLFLNEMGQIREGFEDVFAREQGEPLNPENPYHRARDERYMNEPRTIIRAFIDKSANLQWLRDDARVTAIALGLLGQGFRYAESDGNLFNCDVYWHIDAYGASAGVEHIKLSFYLDELRRETGALRVVPGSQHRGAYAVDLHKRLVADPSQVRAKLGVELDEIPSWTLEVTPGDLIVGNFRTVHGSFNGAACRRLFTVNFAAAEADNA